MAHDEGDFEIVEGAARCGQGCEIVARQTEAVHAGVDVERGWMAAALAGTELGPVADLGQAREDRTQVEACVVRFGVGEQTIKDVNRGSGRDNARALAFVDRCDEKSRAAFARKSGNDFLKAEPICVGLNDAGAFGRGRGFGQLRPIGAQGVEVDLKHSACTGWDGYSGRIGNACDRSADQSCCFGHDRPRW